MNAEFQATIFRSTTTLRAQEATQGVIFRIVYFFCPLNQPYKEQSL